VLTAAELDVDAQSVLVRAGQIVLVVVLAVVLVRVARRAIPRAVARMSDAGGDPTRAQARTRTLAALLGSAVTVVVYGIALFTVLGQVGIALGPLLAGAGVVGLAVGFGAQQLVRDVISGFFVLVEDQYAVGDTVTAGGVTGTVEGLTLRLTKVRGDDGLLHHIRNGDLGVVSNASRGYAVARADLIVPRDSDAEAAAERVRAAMGRLVADGDLDGVLLADPVVLGYTAIRPESSSPVLSVTARVRPEARYAVQRRLLADGLAAVNDTSPRPRRAVPKATDARRASTAGTARSASTASNATTASTAGKAGRSSSARARRPR
jgi:moderate conductance mechanosensitive channel